MGLTTEQKAKAYDEALKRAKTAIDIAADKDLVGGVIRTIFPELRESESEDERIRKKLYNTVMGTPNDSTWFDGTSKEAMLSWLEKQKEQKPEFYPGDVIKCTSSGSLWVRCKDRDNIRSDGHTACIGGGFELASKEEAVQFFQELNENGYQWDCIKGRPIKKEQKPNSTEDMPYVADEHFFEREPADSFKYRLAEYMTKNCKKGEGPYGYSYNISSESILQMAKEELIKRGELKEQKPDLPAGFYITLPDGEKYYAKEMRCKGMNIKVVEPKPAEWSEEDENMRNNILRVLGFFVGNTECESNPSLSTSYPLYQREMDWLKSLRPQPKQEWSDKDSIALKEIQMAISQHCTSENHRRDLCRWLDLRCNAYPIPEKLWPHWKPSEEQLNALNFAITYFMHETNYKNPTELRELHDDLLKLK